MNFMRRSSRFYHTPLGMSRNFPGRFIPDIDRLLFSWQKNRGDIRFEIIFVKRGLPIGRKDNFPGRGSEFKSNLTRSNSKNILLLKSSLEYIVNVIKKFTSPSPQPSPARGEGVLLLSPPLIRSALPTFWRARRSRAEGKDGGEGELCQLIYFFWYNSFRKNSFFPGCSKRFRY